LKTDDKYRLLDSRKEVNRFGITWTMDLGVSNRYHRQRGSLTADELQANLRASLIRSMSKSKFQFEPQANQSLSDQTEEYLSRIAFQSIFKPVQNLNLNNLGSKCYWLQDKNFNMVNMGQRRNKDCLSEFSLFAMLEVKNKNKSGVKEIYLTSLIEVRNELTYDISLTLSLEANESVLLELNSKQSSFVPIKYCVGESFFTLNRIDSKGTGQFISELETRNELHLADYMMDQNYISIKDYYLDENDLGWEYIHKIDAVLTVVMKSDAKGPQEFKIFATIYRKRVPVVIGDNDNQYTNSYKIVFRPMMTVWNLTPRSLEVSVKCEKGVSKSLDSNEFFDYDSSEGFSEQTSLKVKTC
jgi:hypothetical protein